PACPLLPYPTLFRSEFPNTTSLIVAVEPSTLAQGERFVDELAARLIESKDVARQVFYRFKPEDLGGRALLYLPLDQLQKLVSAAGDNAELLSRFLEAPSLDALLRLLNRKISEGMVSHLVGGLFEPETGSSPAPPAPVPAPPAGPAPAGKKDDQVEGLEALTALIRSLQQALLSDQPPAGLPWMSLLPEDVQAQ